jgi:radical SAM-linked protein
MDLDKVMEHIHYLKSRAPKGVKINYHDKFTSRLEAVLSRGDESLNRYIEALYKKGCYLDTWGEYFSAAVWHQTAEECGIDLAELAQKEHTLELPWDFINIGVDKEWLWREFNDSNTAPVCQTGCVNCGVCKNLKTKKVMAPCYRTLDARYSIKTLHQVRGDTCRYRIKIAKTGVLRYFSHLDWQNTFFKAVARAGLPVAFSQGFNPTMKISMGIALPLFMQSECELVDIELGVNGVEVSPAEIKLKLQKNLPVISVEKIPKNAPAIDQTVAWAEYKITLPRFSEDLSRGNPVHLPPPLYKLDDLLYNTEKVLNSENIFIEKRNKKGLNKTIDVKSSVKSYRFQDETLFIVLKTGQSADVPALRADVLMNVIAPGVIFDITRTRFFDQHMKGI